MKLLLQPVLEAFEVLKRHNPKMKFVMTPDTVWYQMQNGDWHIVVTRRGDHKLVVFEPGEKSLSFGALAFEQTYPAEVRKY